MALTEGQFIEYPFNDNVENLLSSRCWVQWEVRYIRSLNFSAPKSVMERKVSYTHMEWYLAVIKFSEANQGRVMG